MGFFNSAPEIIESFYPEDFSAASYMRDDEAIVYVHRENGWEERDPRNGGWSRDDASIDVYGVGSLRKMEKLFEDVFEHAFDNGGAFDNPASEQVFHIYLDADEYGECCHQKGYYYSHHWIYGDDGNHDIVKFIEYSNGEVLARYDVDAGF